VTTGRAHILLRTASTLGVAALAFAPVAAAAQEVQPQARTPAEPTAPAGEGPQTYPAEYFARFSPANAADMLVQVPGFIVVSADQRRGLGEGGANVLINGQRISGKSNDIMAELSRIPARNVTGIEIVEGASLNVPGLIGQVANVIARAGGLSGQFAWRPEVRTRFVSPGLYDASASVSGSSGSFDYTVGVANESFRGGGGGPAEIFDRFGSLTERRDDVVLFSGDRPKISGSLRYDGPGSAVGNLNLSYDRFYLRGRETSERAPLGRSDRVRRFRQDLREYGYEIGGDYELPVLGGRLKLIGLHNFRHSPRDAVSIISFADLSPSVGSRFVRVGDTSEAIVRSEYRWRSGVSDWQISAEGALNSLHNVGSLFVLGPDGAFQEVPLPGASARVEEERAEASITFGRPLSGDLTLQAQLASEFSRLRQVGLDAEPRSFFRPKGFVSLAWTPSPRLDLNLKLERTVGQLNFFDFLASESLSDDRSNSANPDLVPPQSWDATLSATRRLGPFGTTSARLYTRLIEDIVDQIPIGETGQAPGNLPRATVFGVEWRSTINFDPFGWRGARLDTTVQLQNSALEDPLLGTRRRISRDLVRNIDLSLRHDVPGTPWAWGANAADSRRADVVRLDEIAREFDSPAFVSLFVEHKNLLGLTVRLTYRNLFGSENYVTRTVFGGRRTNPVDSVEVRQRAIGPTVALSVSGTF
jgi:hypothetical protein